MRRLTWLLVVLACVTSAARAADEKTLKALQAPPPAVLLPFTPGSNPRPVRFVRVVVQLPPEPWAFLHPGVKVASDGVTPLYYPDRLITWEEGRQEVKPSAISAIFDTELRAAGGKTNSNGESLFADNSDADLQIAVKIPQMAGRFCQSCGWGNAEKWTGAVTMTARWEIYSSLDRRVLATVETSGGYATARVGLDGEPDRLINEAFRDNVRRLIASDDFRRIVTTPVGSLSTDKPQLATMTLKSSSHGSALADATKSVALVFANDGSGSGFLVSDDGYLITNHHVVGASKFVKLKWSDGAETLGEVVRSDPRRDVALVKTDRGARPVLALRHTRPEPSETVFAIGSPLGDRYQNTLSKGIVSALRTEGGLSFIQSDVMINHGSSGGPLLDEKGNVIGLAVSGQIAGGAPVGLNFFIPIDDALKALSLSLAG